MIGEPQGLLASYATNARENCRVGNGPRVTVAVHVHVAPTQAAAEARARSYGDLRHTNRRVT